MDSPSFSLPQLFVVYTYDLVEGNPVCFVYGATMQQGMSQEDATALADRLRAQDSAATVMVLPITAPVPHA